jgi:hypothetical protein
VMLNGVAVGSINYAGQTRGKASFPVSTGLLREGVNTVQLVAAVSGADINLVDTVQINYPRSYTADSNMLRFGASGGQQVTIGGFTAADIRVVDVTNPSQPQELIGAILGSKSSASITLSVPGTGPRVLYAFTGNRALSVTPKANTPSDLHAEGAMADYIMISTTDLMASLTPLKTFRQNQGLRVAVFNVEDIYDEFSFGNKSPQAVKDFLAFANINWRVPPRFVLFAGDASYDSKNYLGFGNSDLVPTKLYDSVFMEAATDDWFVDFDSDGVPDAAVGRLPVRTAAEAATLVSKIIRYESSSSANSALLASDLAEGFDFAAVNAQLRALLPSGMQVKEVVRGNADDATVRSQILAAINQGQTLINYNGHGSVNQWRANILANSDAAGMTNSQKLSLFVMMTCLNGYFNDPALDSLSEAVLKSNGGAAGVWASAAQCTPSAQAAINLELYRLLFSGSGLTVGEATARAKAAINDPDVRRSWIYFGDPAMRLN